MKKLLFIILLIPAICSAQTVYQITVQPIHVGNVGQYTANAVNVSFDAFNIVTDTVIKANCHLIYIDANGSSAIPSEWADFTVDISWPKSSSRSNAVLLGWRNAILAATEPDLIIR